VFPSAAAPADAYSISLHDALPISVDGIGIIFSDTLGNTFADLINRCDFVLGGGSQCIDILKMVGQLFCNRFTNISDTECKQYFRSEEHTSELQSRENLVCRLLLAK